MPLPYGLTADSEHGHVFGERQKHLVVYILLFNLISNFTILIFQIRTSLLLFRLENEEDVIFRTWTKLQNARYILYNIDMQRCVFPICYICIWMVVAVWLTLVLGCLKTYIMWYIYLYRSNRFTCAFMLNRWATMGTMDYGIPSRASQPSQPGPGPRNHGFCGFWIGMLSAHREN